MKFFLLSMTLVAALCGTATQTLAAAYGSSILNTSNVRLQYFNGSTWADATTAQATLFSSTVFSQSTATLGASTITSGLVSGFNAPQSFVSPTLSAPTELASPPLTGLGPSATDSFARGDTLGSGSTIISGSINASTLAELNALGSLSGYANGNVGGTSIFQVNVSQTGSYRLAYTAGLSMQTTGDAYSNSEFRVQVNGAGVAIDYADALLNRSISGTNTVNVGPTQFFSPAATLTALNPIYIFTINQNSTVGANVIPEPTSLAIFGLMSTGTILVRRRRRG
jgi:hypothetical protein